MTRPATRIDLRQEAYEVIAVATAKKLPQETGGILLGYGQDTDIVVTHALEVDGEGASTHRYVRDDVTANALLAAFLTERASDDPTGYIGEWHSHPAPVGPSPTDITAMKAIARDHDGPLALVVYTPKGTHPLFGRITRRQRWGRVTSKAVTVLPPPPRFEALGPLPADAVRADGPVFISYRQSDGTPQAESIENLLRAAGLVVWRDHRDLRPGTTTDRLEQALTQGLSAAVLVVTPEIAHSDIVRERELPRLLQLDEHPAFSLCIANTTARAGSPTQCDYDAPDRLLRLAPSRTLADKKQNNMLQPTGESEIVRDLLMHRTEQRKPATHSEDRPFTIRVQTRPVPFAMDAGEDDLHIRIQAANEGRLPSRTGLQLLQTTLPLTSDAVYATRARTVRIGGGAHLSVALALGAALPETKIGNVEVVDAKNALWASAEAGDDPLTGELHTQPVDFGKSESHDGQNRVAVLVSLTPDPDLTAFERLLDQSGGGFTEAAILTVVGEDRLDPREAARLSTTAAQQIKRLAARHGHAEVHLAFHGPYTMALLVGRHLNTLRTVVYEWDNATLGKPLYAPALVLEPGVAGGPITEVLLNP